MSQRFLGVPYPLYKDARGYFHSQSGLQQIKSDLLILLLTNPGERIMLNDFGTPLRQLSFEPNNVSLASKARDLIIAAIAAWEPRVAIQNIEVLTQGDPSTMSPLDDQTRTNQILTIKISFIDPENIQSVEELQLEVPLNSS